MTFENRGKIYNNITETIGATPLVRLNRLPEQYGVSAEILLKLEFFNPMASVKDRCLLYTSPSPRDVRSSRMPSSA